MEHKVVLLLADGLRPDCLTVCGSESANHLLRSSRYSLSAQTVFPSMTLPAHFSLFLSVPPQRHGILSNVYTPQVRPVDGLFEQVARFGGKSAMFYDWEPLRDLSRPGCLAETGFVAAADAMGAFQSMHRSAEAAIDCLWRDRPDFLFLYFGLPDEAGHRFGWMGDEYLQAVSAVFRQAEQVLDALPPCYRLLFTADHGGHDRIHGTDLAADMTIPLFAFGPEFGTGRFEARPSILDLAPTAAALLGIPPVPDWEGRSLILPR